HAYKPEGDNVSPALRFSDVPKDAKDLVLICHDPDAPRPHGWTHWALYNIPTDVDGLAEGSNGGFTEGVTDFGAPGWGGPLPPPGHGVHRYYFWLYALDKKLGGKPGLSRLEILDLISGHVIAQERLVATYER
ncbi:MAG: YbhB/YbcL family Raf kinase inhibitor-like protein, partial [Candidatus Methylomirabilis sp.]|nr:YbhB/YbcL family Raf kinase inhibitor-like protein [Deltaproteobacteria bacterium]